MTATPLVKNDKQSRYQYCSRSLPGSFSFKTDTPFDINVLTRFSLRFSFCKITCTLISWLIKLVSSYTNSCFSVGKGIQTLLLNINYYSLDYLMLILALVDIGGFLNPISIFYDFDVVVQVKKTYRRRYFMKFMPENISENLKNVKLNSYNKVMFAA